MWGTDIIGPFPPTSRYKKYILVIVDYFTKWIEAEPLQRITSQQIKSFVWKNICRFGLPYAIAIDNGKQFTDRKLKEFYEELGIKHLTSSIEHPKLMGKQKLQIK